MPFQGHSSLVELSKPLALVQEVLPGWARELARDQSDPFIVYLRSNSRPLSVEGNF